MRNTSGSKIKRLSDFRREKEARSHRGAPPLAPEHLDIERDMPELGKGGRMRTAYEFALQ